MTDKAVRIINFADFHAPTSELYKSSKILKLRGNITLNNYLYVHDSFTRRIPSPLQDTFKCINRIHNHYTRNSKKQCVELPASPTIAYGINVTTSQFARNWNYLQVTHFRDKYIPSLKKPV